MANIQHLLTQTWKNWTNGTWSITTTYTKCKLMILQGPASSTNTAAGGDVAVKLQKVVSGTPALLAQADALAPAGKTVAVGVPPTILTGMATIGTYALKLAAGPDTSVADTAMLTVKIVEIDPTGGDEP